MESQADQITAQEIWSPELLLDTVPYKGLDENGAISITSAFLTRSYGMARAHIDGFNAFLDSIPETVKQLTVYTPIHRVKAKTSLAYGTQTDATSQYRDFLTELQKKQVGAEVWAAIKKARDGKKDKTVFVDAEDNKEEPIVTQGKVTCIGSRFGRCTQSPSTVLRGAYSCTLHVQYEYGIVKMQGKKQIDYQRLFKTPQEMHMPMRVIVGCRVCYTIDPDTGERKSREALLAMGEDPLDKGGYFVQDGTKYSVCNTEVRPVQRVGRQAPNGDAFTEEVTVRRKWTGKETQNNFHVSFSTLAGPIPGASRNPRKANRYPSAVGQADAPIREEDEPVKIGAKKRKHAQIKRLALPCEGYDISTVNEMLLHAMGKPEAARTERAKAEKIQKTMPIRRDVRWITVQVYVGKMEMLSAKWFLVLAGIDTAEKMFAAVRLTDPDDIADRYREYIIDAWNVEPDMTQDKILVTIGHLWTTQKDCTDKEYIQHALYYLNKKFCSNYSKYSDKILNLLQHINMAAKILSGVAAPANIYDFANHAIETVQQTCAAAFQTFIARMQDAWKGLLKQHAGAYLDAEIPMFVESALLNFCLNPQRSAKDEHRMRLRKAKSRKWRTDSVPAAPPTRMYNKKQRIATGHNTLQDLAAVAKLRPNTDSRSGGDGHKKTHPSLPLVLAPEDTPHNGNECAFTRANSMLTTVSVGASEAEDKFIIERAILPFLDGYGHGEDKSISFSVPALAVILANEARSGRMAHEAYPDCAFASKIAAAPESTCTSPNRVSVVVANRDQLRLGCTSNPEKLKEALWDLKRRPLARAGVMQLAVTIDPLYRVLTVFTGAGRLVKPTLYLDRSTQLPMFTPEVIADLQRDQALALRGELLPITDEVRQAQLRHRLKSMLAAGSIVYVDVRELTMERVAPTMACLIDQSPLAVADRKSNPFRFLEIGQTASVVSSIIAHPNNCYVPRLISATCNIKRAITKDGSGTRVAGGRSFSLETPQSSPVPTVFASFLCPNGIGQVHNALFGEFTMNNDEDGITKSETTADAGVDRHCEIRKIARTAFKTKTDMLLCWQAWLNLPFEFRRGKPAPPREYLIDPDLSGTEYVIPDINDVQSRTRNDYIMDALINPNDGLPNVGAYIDTERTIIRVMEMKEKDIADELKSTNDLSALTRVLRESQLAGVDMASGPYYEKAAGFSSKMVARTGVPISAARSFSKVPGQISDVTLIPLEERRIRIEVCVTVEAQIIRHQGGDKEQYQDGGGKVTASSTFCADESALGTGRPLLAARRGEVDRDGKQVLTRPKLLFKEAMPHSPTGQFVGQALGPCAIPSRKTAGAFIQMVNSVAAVGNPDLVVRTTKRKVAEVSAHTNDHIYNSVTDPAPKSFSRPQSLGNVKTSDYRYAEIMATELSNGENRFPVDHGMWEIFCLNYQGMFDGTVNAFIHQDARDAFGIQELSRAFSLFDDDDGGEADDGIPLTTTSADLDASRKLEACICRFWRETAQERGPDIEAIVRGRPEPLARMQERLFGRCVYLMGTSFETPGYDRQIHDAARRQILRLRTLIYTAVDVDDLDFQNRTRQLVGRGQCCFGTTDDSKGYKFDLDDEIRRMIQLIETKMYMKPSGELSKCSFAFAPLPFNRLDKWAASMHKPCNNKARDVHTHTAEGVKFGRMETNNLMQRSPATHNTLVNVHADGSVMTTCTRCGQPNLSVFRLRNAALPWCHSCGNTEDFTRIACRYKTEQFAKTLAQIGSRVVITPEDKPEAPPVVFAPVAASQNTGFAIGAKEAGGPRFVGDDADHNDSGGDAAGNRKRKAESE